MNSTGICLVGPTRDYLETLYEKTPARSQGMVNLSRPHPVHDHVCRRTGSLRQHLTIENASTFLSTVLEYMSYHPKELLWIARWLANNGAGSYAAVCELLEAEFGGELYHYPPAPT